MKISDRGKNFELGAGRIRAFIAAQRVALGVGADAGAQHPRSFKIDDLGAAAVWMQAMNADAMYGFLVRQYVRFLVSQRTLVPHVLEMRSKLTSPLLRPPKALRRDTRLAMPKAYGPLPQQHPFRVTAIRGLQVLVLR